MRIETKLKALQAVADGRVTRTYYGSGSRIRGGGTSAAVLWRLVSDGFIEDGDGHPSFLNTYKMKLTGTGVKTLAGSASD